MMMGMLKKPPVNHRIARGGRGDKAGGAESEKRAKKADRADRADRAEGSERGDGAERVRKDTSGKLGKGRSARRSVRPSAAARRSVRPSARAAAAAPTAATPAAACRAAITPAPRRAAASTVSRRTPAAGKAFRCALAALLAACLASPLTGCKDSSAITELIQDQNAEWVDYDNEEKIYQEATGEMLETMEARELTGAEREALEEQQTQTEYSEESEDEGESDGQTSSEYSDSSEDASNGTGSGTSSSSSGTHNTVKSTTGSSLQASQTPSGDGGETNTDNPASSGATKWDADSPDADLPEGTSYIAACGQYALMVQMLAGGDTSGAALAAADQSFLSWCSSKGVYANEGIGTVTAAWSGDGSSSDQLDVDVLLNLAAQGKLQTVLVGSDDSSLSQDQADALYAAGVNVVVMPSLRTDEGITTSVEVVGRLLADADTYYDAQAMAEEYVRQHDEAIEDAKNANGGYAVLQTGDSTTSTVLLQPGDAFDGDSRATLMGAQTTTEHGATAYTAYIEDWTTTDYYTNHSVPSSFSLDITDAETNGIGLVRQNYQASPYMYYLQAGGVMNASLMFSSIPRSGYDVDVMLPASRATYDTGTGNWGAANLLSVSAYSGDFYLRWDYYGRNIGTGYRDEDYMPGGSGVSWPAIIAKTNDIAAKIQRSSNTYGGVYRFADQNNTSNSYSVYVMPSGYASWGDGGVESFLVSVWAYSMFHNNGSASQAESYVSSFYETFFRCGYGAVVSDLQTVYACGN